MLSQSTYRFSLGFALVFSTVITGLSHAAENGPRDEGELIAVLQSDAPKSEKAITCKYLAVYGGKDSVPAIAPLLEDPELTSWARIPLEVIEDPAADEALRTALGKLEGRMLIGVINSIGVRRDAEAVPGLIIRLQDADAGVASAAAVTLGKIGDDKSAEALESALTDSPEAVRSAVAEGCILCAEQALAAGRQDAAVAMYDKVLAANVNQQRTREAIRGAILARGEDGVPVLVEQLTSDDYARFTIGVQTAREMEVGGVTEALVGQLASADDARRTLLIEAIATIGDEAGLPALLELAGGEDRGPKVIALRVLKRIGNASCIATLLEAATHSNVEVAQAATESLEELQGEAIDAELAKLLPDAKGAMRQVLLELVGRRRISVVPEVIKSLDDPDAKTRAVALMALGETIGPDQLNVLITQAVTPSHATDADAARAALKAASVRMPDREACAEQLADAFGQAPSDARVTLIETLGAVGGTTALNVLADAVATGTDDQKDAASRLLGGWMTVDAGPVMIDLTEKLPSGKYRIRVLRGYIRIARQFVESNEQQLAMCQQALAAADRDAERLLVLQVLDRIPTVESLELMLKIAERPSLAKDAKNMALGLAASIPNEPARVKELMQAAGFNSVELVIEQAQYGAGDKVVDVTETLRKSVGGFATVKLPSSSYNSAFGGDPAPGVVKQLQVVYTWNGKRGEATFAENAPIVLQEP